MACNPWGAKLEAYVDDELTSQESAAFEAHLDGCAECTRELAQSIQIKRQTQAALKRYTPSAEFRQRVQQRVFGRKKKVWSFSLWPQLAVAAALLLLAILPAYFSARRAQLQTMGELADLHVATLASASPVDVVSTDRHTVKPWFAGKLPFSFNLPELGGSSFTLVGGRMAYFHQSPGAQLIYQVRQHKISVFIFQDRPEVYSRWTASGGTLQQLSFNEQTWSAAGLRYFLVSDASPDDIQQLSELLRNAAR